MPGATSRQRRRSDADSFSFGASVGAGNTSEITEELRADGTIEYVQIRIYVGAELDLQIKPVILDANGNERPIVKLGGKDYIDGDDDVYEFHPTKPVRQNDTVIFRATNNGTNALDYRANIDLDYRGGLESVVDTVVRGVGL